MNSKLSSPLLFVFAIVAMVAIFGSQSIGAATQDVQIQYQVDRSAVPLLNDYDLTLIIDVSDAQTISIVDGSNNPLDYAAGPNANEIMLTTDATEINVELFDVTETSTLGNFRKAALKDNFTWVYTHEFDDNYFLDEETAIFLSRGVPATFNVVSDWISDPGNIWNGDFQYQEFKTLVDAGWDILNHTVDHEDSCSADYDRADRKADVLAAQNQIRSLLAGTTRPTYHVIGFTIPCGFLAQMRDYPGVINEIRDNSEDTLLFTVGASTNPIYTDLSSPFDIETLISRDGRIDGAGAITSVITDQMDQTSAAAKADNTPYWYNTFSHGEHLFGDNTSVLAQSLDYVIDTYGSEGTNEVWIAPTAVVISYLLVRDLSVVLKDGEPLPTPTPSPTPTQIPVSCNEIDNPGFENGLESWQSFGQLEIVSGRSGNGLAVSDGFTSQNISVGQLDSFLFRGYSAIDQLDNGSWMGVGIDYLDGSGEEIGDTVLQLIPTTTGEFVEFEITGTPPAGTASLDVWLFSASTQAKLAFDDLIFAWATCDPTPPTATPTTEPPGSTATPTATPVNPPATTSTPAPTTTPNGTVAPPVNFDVFIYLPIHMR